MPNSFNRSNSPVAASVNISTDWSSDFPIADAVSPRTPMYFVASNPAADNLANDAATVSIWYGVLAAKSAIHFIAFDAASELPSMVFRDVSRVS